MRGSEAFRAMLGGMKVRRAAWPEGCSWSADLEDCEVKPVITGPPAWVRRCHKDERWTANQWRYKDWEVSE